MPVTLDLHQEEYPPTGGIGGEGQRKVLGRPKMEVLTLLAREALQNSWDARTAPQGPITFMVHAWTLTSTELRVARKQVFPEIPGRLPLGAILAGDSVSAICVSDRGTRGLVGPTRADELDLRDPQRNFVAFIRDVGRAAGTQVEGGTYGYGKASFYMASRASTICVHTRVMNGRRPEDRFIAAGVGDQHNASSGSRRVRRTGRCWWGRADRSGHVDPLTGPEAREIAEALGMPPFEEDQTGTSILVLAPDLGMDSDSEVVQRTLEQAVNRIVNDLLWCAWPKMLPGRSGKPPIEFQAKVRRDGAYREIPFPDPTRYAPLACFVQAYRAALHSLQSGRMADGGCTVIRRYAETVGWLSLKNFGVLPRRLRLDTGERDGADWVGSPSHHVALMRKPRLIVRYVEGPPLPTDVLEYAGVFIPTEDAEEAFALAEPPTHDDWRPETVADGRMKSQVRVAIQKIKEETRRFVGRLAGVGGGASELAPLGAFSDELGNLLSQVEGSGRPTVPGPGGGGGGRGGGGGPRHRRASIRMLEDIEYAMIGERKVVVIPFQVFPVPGTSGTKVRAVAHVSVADGDAEREPPEGALVPEVVAWLSPSGAPLETAAELAQIPAFELGVWKVQISLPDDAMITVDLKAE